MTRANRLALVLLLGGFVLPGSASRAAEFTPVLAAPQPSYRTHSLPAGISPWALLNAWADADAEPGDGGFGEQVPAVGCAAAREDEGCGTREPPAHGREAKPLPVLSLFPSAPDAAAGCSGAPTTGTGPSAPAPLAPLSCPPVVELPPSARMWMDDLHLRPPSFDPGVFRPPRADGRAA